MVTIRMAGGWFKFDLVFADVLHERNEIQRNLVDVHGPFTWFEPDFSELARILRHVYEHREEAGQCGRLAGNHVRQPFAWPRITRSIWIASTF